MPRRFKKRYHIQEVLVNGCTVYSISPLNKNHEIHIIYTHGGAYAMPLQSFHWRIIESLIKKVGASISVPIYPLAPEFSYKTTFDLLERIYQGVLGQYADQKIVLCGDSAGGGLALAQAFRYRDLGIQLPDHIILFAPWLDITMSNPEAAEIEKQDKLLGIPGLVQCGQWWAGGEQPQNPLLSPIFGDFSGLPPIDIYQGTSDLFIADARKLHGKVAAAGGDIHLYDYPGAFHVFLVATFTPEAKDAYAKIASSLLSSQDS